VAFRCVWLLCSWTLVGRIRCGAVGMVTWYGLDTEESRLWSRHGQEILSFLLSVETSSGAHAASYSVGTEDSSCEVKRRAAEANHSLPPSDGVRNEWFYYTFTPPYTFMAYMVLNFTIVGLYIQTAWIGCFSDCSQSPENSLATNVVFTTISGEAVSISRVRYDCEFRLPGRLCEMLRRRIFNVHCQA
jgi:hypothetical protein